MADMFDCFLKQRALVYHCNKSLLLLGAEFNTCSIIAVSLVSPAIVSTITVVRVKQVDVLIVVTGQELCTDRKDHRHFGLIPFSYIKAEDALSDRGESHKLNEVVDFNININWT